MKILILIPLFFMYSFHAFSQNDTVLLEMTLISEIDQEYRDSIGLHLKPLWVSNEITNVEYRIFINDIVGNEDNVLWADMPQIINEIKELFDVEKDSFTIKEILPYFINTLSLSNEYPKKSREYHKYKKYFTKKKYNKYPVVGVTYIGALNYCRWLTNIEAVKLINKSKYTDYKHSQGVILTKYRLPTEKEWSFLNHIASKDSIKLSNAEIESTLNQTNNKIKNIQGNVSEWIDVFNNPNPQIRGDSWKKNSDTLIFNKQTSKGYIGFRVIKSGK